MNIRDIGTHLSKAFAGDALGGDVHELTLLWGTKVVKWMSRKREVAKWKWESEFLLASEMCEKVKCERRGKVKSVEGKSENMNWLVSCFYW